MTRLLPVRTPRLTWLVLAAGASLVASGCGAAESEAGGAPPAPLPTIGLGSQFESPGQPGVISGAADVRAVGADDIDTVVMIGDSITRGSTPKLYERFETMGIENILIESENGKRIAVSSRNNPSGAAIAGFLTSVDADDDSDESLDDDHSDEMWVVALGTNDVGQYSSPDQIAAAVNEVLAAVPEESPVVWVDVYFRDRPEQQELINSIIAERLERRGNAVLAPWSFFGGAEGLTVSDGVHPTESGKDAFAFVVADTVQAFLDR